MKQCAKVNLYLVKRHSVDKSISWKSMNLHFTFMTAALSRIPGGYVFSNDNDKNFLKNIEFG